MTPSWHADASELISDDRFMRNKACLIFYAEEPRLQSTIQELRGADCSAEAAWHDGDAALIQKRLEDVDYQRLQAYWSTDSQGNINADIETVWAHYCFDRQVRLLLLDAIERIEVAVRNRLVHYFSEAYGPYGYLKPVNFHPIVGSGAKQGVTHGAGRASSPQEKWQNDYKKWRKKLFYAAQVSNLLLLRDYKAKYFSKRFPLWHICEVMDFGSVVFSIALLNKESRKRCRVRLGFPPRSFSPHGCVLSTMFETPAPITIASGIVTGSKACLFPLLSRTGMRSMMLARLNGFLRPLAALLLLICNKQVVC